jgi:hypothetical protein
VFWVCGEGLVDRTGSYHESLGASLAKGVRPRHSFQELPMAGICERWTGVLVIPGEVLSWHGELLIPF